MEWQRFKVSNKWLSDSGQELSWKDQRWRVTFKEVWAKGTCAGRAGVLTQTAYFSNFCHGHEKAPGAEEAGSEPWTRGLPQ